MIENSTIRCINCKYYQITWDVENPYGCNKLGFKTKLEPSNYVVQISGNICQGFTKKIKSK